MKKRQLSKGYRLYLSPSEYQTLLETAPEVGTYALPEEIELMLRLGAESGYRGDESHRATPGHIVESSDPESDVAFIEVWGKDTSGKTDDGKYRKTVLTKATVACMERIREKRHLNDDDPFISVGRGQLDNWADELGRLAADKTGKESFRHFTVHDLRAYFATNSLVRHNINMETVMTVGGWEDYETMKRYLSVTSDEQIIDDFEEAGLLEGTDWEKYADYEPDDGSVYSKLTASTPMGAAAELSALGADQMASRVESFAAQSQQDSWTFGRFSRPETETALRAGTYGAFVGLGAAGLATSVPSLSPSAAMTGATLLLAAPLARGWHHPDGTKL